MEILELMRILLYFMTNYTPYWKKIPHPGLKTGYWGNMEIGGNEIFCGKEVQMLSAEGNCKQNLWLFFCLTIPTLDVEKRDKKWTDNWWTYLLFAAMSSGKYHGQVSHFENILWCLDPSSKCFVKGSCELSWAMFTWRWEESRLVLLSHKLPVSWFPSLFYFPRK